MTHIHHAGQHAVCRALQVKQRQYELYGRGFWVLTQHALCAQRVASNYGAFVSTVPAFLNVVDFAHRLVGPKPLEYLSSAMNRASGHMIPTWNPYMPRVRGSCCPSPPAWSYSVSACMHISSSPQCKNFVVVRMLACLHQRPGCCIITIDGHCTFHFVRYAGQNLIGMGRC